MWLLGLRVQDIFYLGGPATAPASGPADSPEKVP
jgi:hypothetical protein